MFASVWPLGGSQRELRPIILIYLNSNDMQPSNSLVLKTYLLHKTERLAHTSRGTFPGRQDSQPLPKENKLSAGAWAHQEQGHDGRKPHRTIHTHHTSHIAYTYYILTCSPGTTHTHHTHAIYHTHAHHIPHITYHALTHHAHTIPHHNHTSQI